MSLKPKVIGSNVSAVLCQRMEFRRQWVEGVKTGVGGKTIGELMLFWETNKKANVTPREACGPAGCCASWQMWAETRNWWAGFHNRESERVMKLIREEQQQVYVCVTVCACVCMIKVLEVSSSCQVYSQHHNNNNRDDGAREREWDPSFKCLKKNISSLMSRVHVSKHTHGLIITTNKRLNIYSCGLHAWNSVLLDAENLMWLNVGCVYH